MELSDFTEEEIRQELENLGYKGVPDDRLQQFKKDLSDLVRVERSKNSSSSFQDSSTDFGQPKSKTVVLNHADQGFKYRDVNHRINSDFHPSLPPRRNSYDDYIAGTNTLFGVNSHGEGPDSENETLNSTATSTDSRRIIKRKVLRRDEEGRRHIFEESSISESEPDLEELQARLHAMPIRINPHAYDPSVGAKVYCDRRGDRMERPALVERQEPAYRLPDNFEGVKAVIRPLTSDPHSRNVKRSDPVANYHKYNQAWSQQHAPGEKAHKGLRWNVREQMLYHDTVVQKRCQKPVSINNYVVPTEKKRKNLRWQIRNDLAQGVKPPSIFD